MSLKDKIHNEILNEIIKGNFPLEQFINEGELAARYNVSKGPVREALIELCYENVLRSIPRSGYQIIQLTERNIKKAIPLIDEARLDSISRLNNECEKLKNEGPFTIEEHWKYNIRFHLLLNSFAGNNYINKVLSDSLKLVWRAYVQLYSDADHETYILMDLKRHFEIEQAIREKDVDKATDLLQKDILFIRGKLFST